MTDPRTVIRDKVAAALRPHLGHQEYLGDAVWRCPCGEVWSDGKHLADAAISAHNEALEQAARIERNTSHDH